MKWWVDSWRGRWFLQVPVLLPWLAFMVKTWIQSLSDMPKGVKLSLVVGGPGVIHVSGYNRYLFDV